MSNPGVKYNSDAVILKADDSKVIPLTLKSSKGAVIFTGTFDIDTETLTGMFTNSLEEVTVRASAKLNCVSQPRLTLESSDQDIAL